MAEEPKKDDVEVTTTPVDANPQKGNDEIDYKAELEATKKRLSQAEHTIVKLKKEPKEDGSESIRLEDIEEVVSKRVAESLERAKTEIASDVIEEELARLTANEDEKALIRLNYEKTIVKSGLSRAAIIADLQNAKVLANKPRFDKLISEATRSVDTKQKMGSGYASGHQPETPAELSPAEEKAIQAMAARTGKTVDEVRNKLLANRNK